MRLSWYGDGWSMSWVVIFESCKRVARVLYVEKGKKMKGFSFSLFFFLSILSSLFHFIFFLSNIFGSPSMVASFFFPHTSLLFSLFFYPMMIRFFYTFLFSLKILHLFIVFFIFSQLLGEKGTKFHFGPFFLVLRFTYRPFFNLIFIIFLCFDFFLEKMSTRGKLSKITK